MNLLNKSFLLSLSLILSLWIAILTIDWILVALSFFLTSSALSFHVVRTFFIILFLAFSVNGNNFLSNLSIIYLLIESHESLTTSFLFLLRISFNLGKIFILVMNLNLFNGPFLSGLRVSKISKALVIFSVFSLSFLSATFLGIFLKKLIKIFAFLFGSCFLTFESHCLIANGSRRLFLLSILLKMLINKSLVLSFLSSMSLTLSIISFHLLIIVWVTFLFELSTIGNIFFKVSSFALFLIPSKASFNKSLFLSNLSFTTLNIMSFVIFLSFWIESFGFGLIPFNESKPLVICFLTVSSLFLLFLIIIFLKKFWILFAWSLSPNFLVFLIHLVKATGSFNWSALSNLLILSIKIFLTLFIFLYLSLPLIPLATFWIVVAKSLSFLSSAFFFQRLIT